MTVVSHFVPLGYAIYGHDQRGHGLSPGNRGHINKFDDLVQDLHKFITFVNDRENLPIFLFGNSMGGAVTIYYTLTISNPLIRGCRLCRYILNTAGIVVNAP